MGGEEGKCGEVFLLFWTVGLDLRITYYLFLFFVHRDRLSKAQRIFGERKEGHLMGVACKNWGYLTINN